MEDENKILKAAALKYDQEKNQAPTLVAKGKGELAKNIVKLAKENNIPIRKDEDLVELLTKLEIDQEIPPDMYKAIAEIFAFIYGLTKK